MAHIEAHIGDVSGGSQVAVGNYIVQIGRVEGGVVNILNEAPPPPKLRPQPVLLRPKVFPGLLDRQTETTTTLNALMSQQSVECTGQPGAGRTSLLRHLAHQSALPQLFSSGIVYFKVNQQSAPDLLKSLFDVFYSYDFPIKPNETEMRHFLQSINALVLLDDVEIDAQQIEYLMNLTPNCTYIAVTTARVLSTDVVEVQVKGLPAADALLLFQKELGRALSSEEENSTRSTCESVGCIPLRVVRAAHAAQDQQPSSPDEKKVLATLAVFDGANVAAEHVAAVAGVENVKPLLENLEQRGLVQSHEQSYSLAPDVNVTEPEDRKSWFTNALNYFVDWTEQHRTDHKRLAASGGVILVLLKQAVDARLWSEVRRLGHASEEALTITGKWDMWANVLDSIELAAKAQGDLAESAWVLHQLGTRALCHGDRYPAETALRDALSIRERLNDHSGAAVTRHNLALLVGPLPLKSDDDSQGDSGIGPKPASLWLKGGIVALVGLAALTALLIWRYASSRQTIKPARIVSFSVNPATIPADGQAQLCYEVENAQSVRIEPNIGERRPATKECFNITPGETLTYTLTAFGANATTPTQQTTLTVEAVPTPPPPPKAEIVYFAVDHAEGSQLRLCYEVHKAVRAEIDNNAGAVVLDQRHCQSITPAQTTTYTLSATGADGVTITRQAIADATKPPEPLPEINNLRHLPEEVIDDGIASICFVLKHASTAQLDPGARVVRIENGEQCVAVRPLKTTTFTVRAFNADGKEVSQSTTIKVIHPPKIVEFTVTPQRITRGDSVSLCFRVENADRVGIEPGVTKNRPAGGGERICLPQRPRATTTYALIAYGDGGLSTPAREETVTVEEPQAPAVKIISFEIKSRILGGPQLCYEVENARSARIEPGIGELKKLTQGCANIPSRAQQTYTLTATGADGKTDTKNFTYTPPEPPKEQPIKIILFSGPRQPIKPRSEAKLCYSTIGDGKAEISPQPGSVPPSIRNCVSVLPQQTTVYTLTVTSSQGARQSRKLTVTVLGEVIR